MKKKKSIIVWAVIAVAAIACLTLIFLLRDSSEPLSIETTTVSRGDVANIVTATGTVEPITQVEVGTQVSGIISHIYVDYNSEVTNGQLIAELDRTTLEAELASSTATMNSARVEYEYQEKNYARQKELHEKKVISDTDFETATYNYEKAKAEYEKSRYDLVRASTNLGYARIYSPIDGVVISRAVDEGQTVAASFSTPTLFTIANDLTQMQVVADVDEADIGSVAEGQRVTFTVDAYPNDIFEGTVTQVRLEATETSNVITYETIINAPNADLKLKPGLTANVTIYTQEERDILYLPLKSLRFIPEPPQGASIAPEHLPENIEPALHPDNELHRTVWVMKDDGSLEPRIVETGLDNGVNIVIRSGVSEGEKVATGYAQASATMDTLSGGDESASPFMPGPPGGNKKK